MKNQNRKSRGGKTKYRKIIIMSILFGSLLIGGSVAAFSNMGKSNTNMQTTNLKQIVSLLTSSNVVGANALGKSNAPINIVEFGDYQCPFCAKFNQLIKDQLISKYIDTGIVRFNFKDFIINDLPKDRLSTLAAEASYCAADQNKYWQFHDEVYKNSKGENTGWVSKESLIRFATNVQIPNISTFIHCLDSHKYSQVVARNDNFAKSLGLKATPTFLVLKHNSTRIVAIEGAQPLNVFSSVIEEFQNNTI